MKIFQKAKTEHNIGALKRLLHKDLAQMKKEKGDRLVAICGYEGSGKSYLALDLFEEYYDNVLKVPKNLEIFKYFCSTDVDWALALDKARNKPYYMIAHDEAINILYSKEGATKKNKEVNKLFKKIRGKRFYYLMCIPQPQRIDKEVREERLRMLLFVFKHKGQRWVAVYTKTRLDTVLPELHRMINSTAKDVKKRPNILDCETAPAVICRIPEYKGRFLDMYAPQKESHMDETIDEVKEVIVGKVSKKDQKIVAKDNFVKEVKKYRRQNMNERQIRKLIGVSQATYYRWIKEEKMHATKQDSY
jgi:hypothetical protein